MGTWYQVITALHSPALIFASMWTTLHRFHPRFIILDNIPTYSSQHSDHYDTLNPTYVGLLYSSVLCVICYNQLIQFTCDFFSCWRWRYYLNIPYHMICTVIFMVVPIVLIIILHPQILIYFLCIVTGPAIFQTLYRYVQDTASL